MKEKTMKFWTYFVAIFAACLLLFLVLLTTVQLFKIKKLKKEEKNLSLELNSLLETKQYYENANAYIESEEFIEKYARDVLNLGKDGDEAYNS